MACCKCCCENGTPPGECCGGVCCKEPDICCGPSGSKACCEDPRVCCGVGSGQECCPEGDECCGEECCPPSQECCDNVCCNEGQHCCDGVCQDEPCDSECEGNGDCQTAICPPGTEGPCDNGECATTDFGFGCDNPGGGYLPPVAGYCCDNQCEEDPCDP